MEDDRAASCRAGGDCWAGKARWIHLKKNGSTYVEVCDSWADGIGPRIHVRWKDGRVYRYGDYNGAGGGCKTHRLGVDDTPVDGWKYVSNHNNSAGLLGLLEHLLHPEVRVAHALVLTRAPSWQGAAATAP